MKDLVLVFRAAGFRRASLSGLGLSNIVGTGSVRHQSQTPF